MTLQECTAILAPVALSMLTPMDEPTFRAYHKALADVPAVLLQEAAETFRTRANVEWFPKAPQWRGLCEVERRRMLALHAYDGCANCEHSVGWCAVTRPDGRPGVEPCGCRKVHAAKLERLGLAGAVAQLPASREPEPESEPDWSDVPAGVRGRLGSIAVRHSMRVVK